MKYYYTNSANQPVGPVDIDELARLEQAGTISENCNVIAEGSTKWIPYRELKGGAATAKVADALAKGVGRATEAACSFSWGSMLFGMLLVIISGLTLPWTILANAARELAQWGKDRLVPSSTSDLPALTQVLIVARPFTHVVFTTVMVFIAVLTLFGTGPVYGAVRGLQQFEYGYEGYSLTRALSSTATLLFAAYFGNWVIAFVYELSGLLVRIANEVRRISAR